ncbi:MAG: hypothetical protein J1F06_00710, partial [Prevotellaceae bacterium]|nr:hypothetical protein [Prevotellaceae bacterium]
FCESGKKSRKTERRKGRTILREPRRVKSEKFSFRGRPTTQKVKVFCAAICHFSRENYRKPG